jgi:signal transduction histidine kinase/CheY-like chemotaxis protein
MSLRESEPRQAEGGNGASANGRNGAWAPGAFDERVLIFAPTGRDGVLACGILREQGIAAEVCAGSEAFAEEAQRGAGVLLLAEEAMSLTAVDAFLQALERQPPWSDLPLIVFARGGDSAENVLATLGTLGNVTILERPVRISTLVSAVQAALRARRRQYEVRDLLQRLEETGRRKDEFLAMLGHELRNPLSAMRNAMEILERSPAPDERVVRQRSVLSRQIAALSRLVDDLLDVSRVTMGKIALQRELVDLREIAERCVQSARAPAAKQRIDVRLSADARPVPVYGDVVRLEQVVSNLINNALKYTPGEGLVAVSVMKEVRASGEEEAVVRVSDDGIGIDPQTLPRIFDLFTQAETSIDRSRGGLGIGLTIVSSLVQMHGGTVSAHSEGRGRGSRFEVRLPVAAEGLGSLVSGPGSRTDRRLEEPRGAGLRVLVVEDNADGRETLRDLLEMWGHEVEVAEDGPAGLRRLLASPPDVAIVDIGLPGLDGYELARQVRGLLDGSRPRLIAMTGYGQPEDQQRALDAGFDTHLVKPVEPGELLEALAA